MDEKLFEGLVEYNRLTKEFVEKHCVHCDRCIFENSEPVACGEIDEGGCVSTQLRQLKLCFKGIPNEPHMTQFKCGDVIESSPSNYHVLGTEGHNYILQREGVFGKFDEPWPIENVDILDFDEMYSEDDLVED